MRKFVQLVWKLNRKEANMKTNTRVYWRGKFY